MAEPLQPTRVDGYVVGLRVWRLQGYRLSSAGLYGAAFWVAGPNTARCLRHEYGTPIEVVAPHRSPHPSCTCGLYARHPDCVDVDNISGEFSPTVYGVVRAWGHIEVHMAGFRAEFAEPVLFAVSRTAHSAAHVRHVEAVASELELDVVDLADLPAHAPRFGRVIPYSLRPTPSEVFEHYYGDRLGRVFTAVAVHEPADARRAVLPVWRRHGGDAPP